MDDLEQAKLTEEFRRRQLSLQGSAGVPSGISISFGTTSPSTTPRLPSVSGR
jgi:hypothetical protein